MDKYIWSHHPVLGEFSFHERFLVVKGMDSQKPHHSQVDQASGASEAGTTVRTSILNLRVEKMHIDSWLLSQKKNYWTSSVVPKWGMLSSNLINAVYFASKMLKETVTWPPFHGFFPIHREVLPFCQPFFGSDSQNFSKTPSFSFSVRPFQPTTRGSGGFSADSKGHPFREAAKIAGEFHLSFHQHFAVANFVPEIMSHNSNTVWWPWISCHIYPQFFP